MIINMTGGSGDGLNFKVVGGTTQPSNPKENTIWVNTSVGITQWYMGNYPSPSWAASNGTVSIYAETCTSSGLNVMNAVKKNTLRLSPIHAYQRVDGAWVLKNAKIYQNGAWNAFWKGELYKAGNEWTEMTGGFATVGRKSSEVSSADSAALTITRGTSSMTLKTGSGKGGVLYAKTMMNLTNFKTITCKGTFTRGGSYARNLGIGVWNSPVPTYYYTDAVAFYGLSSASGTSISLSVANLTGSYIVGLGLTDSTAVVTEFVLS